MIILSSCSKENKDEDTWSNCYDCNLQSWTGSYSGSASFYNAENNDTKEGLGVTVQVTETGTNYLSISLNIPNYYSSTVSGELLSGYSVSFAGSNNSFNGTLYQKEGQLKISGNAKKFHYKVNELVIERVVTFEVIKSSAQ